ncbi:protein OSB1, mitochondrial-like [Tasmannia lanceolata]|uniref:protein OSB1, mitochondrial-like n=1 Tax=Tasmannia lanceolata TaxID=3420 RepID=UPI004063CEE9
MVGTLSSPTSISSAITTSITLLSKSPNPKPQQSFLLFSNKPSSQLSPLSLSSKTHKNLGFCRPLRCATGDYEFEHARLVYPRPAEIPWTKELCNSVHLIGIIGTPIQIKHLSSGKVLAWTRLAVKKSATDTVWINLTLWDELAHVAFQHVEKGQQVYVTGRLVSDTVQGEDGEKPQTYYKVVVQQLNFIEKTSSMSSYAPVTNSVTSGMKHGNFSVNNVGSAEELWQAFFANPVDWWDNRKNKRNPKYPDFKHKDTGEALWIEAKYNPTWVKSQLAILDSRMESHHANGASTSAAFMSGDDFALF